MSKGTQSFSAEHRLSWVVALALVVVLGFYCFCSKQTSPSVAGRPAASLHKYAWKDVSGLVYLAVDSTSALPAAGSVAVQPDLVAIPANVAIPSPVHKGFTREVFQLERQRKGSVAIAQSPAIQDFLVGETHLGKSQLKVARTLCRLLRDFEIDAIFVEQPDDLQYDWSHFASLEQNRDQALAALQYRMVQDAQADPAPFIPYLKDVKTDADQATAISKIEHDFGPSGPAQFQAAMDTEDRYEKSEYVSATDYLYVALHLQGVSIPFHNLDSRKLRDQFIADSEHATSIEDLRPDIAARDDYTIQTGRRVLKDKGYHRVIWIVGAEHLKNLPGLLSAYGDKVEIAYNSLAPSSRQPILKKEMLCLVKPDQLVKFANARVPAEFQPNEDFSIPRGPSRQLNNALASALAQSDLGLNASDRTAIQNSFAQQYEEQALRSHDSWSIKVTIGTGGTVEITKPQRDELQVFHESPVTAQSHQELAKMVPGFSIIDAEVGQRLNRLNAQQHHVSLFTVKDQGTGYAVYANEQPFFEGDDIAELVQHLNEQVTSGQVSAIYLELDGFSAEKARGFEASCRMQQKVLNNDRSLGVLARLNDAFFAPVRLDPNHDPELTVMKTGPFKGFTRMTMNFIAKIGDRIVKITLVIYAITADLAREFHATVRDLLGASPLTLADAITVARNELKKNHQLSDDDLTKQLRTEVGGTLVVEVLRDSVTTA
jgi:hypothetical protein